MDLQAPRGSGAQTPTIQTTDAFLGVQHTPGEALIF